MSGGLLAARQPNHDDYSRAIDHHDILDDIHHVAALYHDHVGAHVNHVIDGAGHHHDFNEYLDHHHSPGDHDDCSSYDHHIDHHDAPRDDNDRGGSLPGSGEHPRR